MEKSSFSFSGSGMMRQVKERDVACCDDKVGYRKSFVRDGAEDILDDIG